MLNANQVKVLEALRSGQFEQTYFTYMRNPKCVCAVGLMCEVLGVERYTDSEGVIRFKGCFSGLPFPLVEPLQLTLEEFETVFHLNDVQKWSFEEIASWLEEHWNDKAKRLLSKEGVS